MLKEGEKLLESRGTFLRKVTGVIKSPMVNEKSKGEIYKINKNKHMIKYIDCRRLSWMGHTNRK